MSGIGLVGGATRRLIQAEAARDPSSGDRPDFIPILNDSVGTNLLYDSGTIVL